MSDDVRRLADAVLYEGHVLWPYRRSSTKNRQRWTFGGVYPEAYATANADRAQVRTECLVEGDAPELGVEVRFLHAVHRQATAGPSRLPVDEVGGYLTWDETTERSVVVAGVRPGAPVDRAIDVAPGEAVEPVDGGALVRRWERLEGRVRCELERVGEALCVARVTIRNDSRWDGLDRDRAVRRTLLSAHALLHVRGGRLVSATDPPARLLARTAGLRNDGLWPVLVGPEDCYDTVLASPIILADRAAVAPESPGDFFDGGEIDQLLVLNILGLSDAEKRELRAGDPRARAMLERTEAMTPQELARLNGAIRDLRPAAGP